MQNTNITKFFGIIAGILTAFVMFFVVVPQEAVAQNEGAIAGERCYVNGQIGTWLPGPTGELQCVSSSGSTVSESNFASTSAKKIPDQFGCSIFGWAGIQGCMAAIGYSVLSFFAVFLGIAGILLNTAIALTVQSMDVYVNGAPNTTTSIELAWRLFRDLGNVVILFVLLFSSIGIILRTDVLVPRGTLAKIIIAAFLINFSLFFTKVIIDISNVFTFTIHQQIEEIGEQTSEDTIAIGVAGAFMKGLAPQRIIKDIDEALKTANGAQISMNIIQQSILGSVVILVATFVFLVMAAMLLVRFVILLLLLITSPIGVVGGLIPKLATYSKQWWSTLIGQAMFAPILMLFMLITVLVINSGGLTQAINDTNQLNPNNIPNVEGVVGTILIFASKFLPTAIQYFIIIALMVFGLIVAKSTAGKFGSGAVEWASKKAGSLAFGTTAGIGRGTLGRFGATLTDENSRFGGVARRMAASNNLISRSFGAGVIASGDKLKKATFDARNTAVGKELGAGKGGKGYEAWYKEQKKNRESEFKNVGAPSAAANATLRQAQRGELSARETLRRIAPNDTTGRINAESALGAATKARKDAENQAKIESAQMRERVGQREQQYARTARGMNRIGSLWTTIVSPADREAAKATEESARKELNKLGLDANKKRLEDVDTLLKQYQARAKTYGAVIKEAEDRKPETAEIEKNSMTGSFYDEHERLRREARTLRDRVKSANEEKKKKETKETLVELIKENKDEGSGEGKEKKGDEGGEKPADKPAT